MTDRALEVLTIGHSTLSYERFLDLLRRSEVTAIADVRTAPYSRHSAHFAKETLREELRRVGIAYVFLGEELGGRPKDKRLFRNGVADYEKMAQAAPFAKGLERVIEGAKNYRIALMCSEHDPLDCHRCLLVGRALHERGVAVRHILSDGTHVNHEQIELRLMGLSGRTDAELFDSNDQRRASAYRYRALRVAYTDNDDIATMSRHRGSSFAKY